jgi:hypothetical protein
VVGSAKDLKPESLIDVRRIADASQVLDLE